jgi:hypothetical protein
MSVLIKGMEMPNRCFKCIFLTTAPSFFCLAGKKDLCAEHGINISRPDWCPLIELPPHGRLGDLDKLMTEFMDSDLDHLQRDDWKEVIQIVADAPTIIEAEGSEE